MLFLATVAVFWDLVPTGQENWWAAFPRGALLGLGLTVLADEAGPPGGDAWRGSLFLGSIGADFAAAYLREHERWWALTLAGALFTLTLSAAWDTTAVGERASRALFFAGLALTFIFVAVLPGDRDDDGRSRSPPTALGGVLAVLITLEVMALLRAFEYLWPLALIAGGGFLLWRVLGQRHTAEPIEGGGERPPSSSEEHGSH